MRKFWITFLILLSFLVLPSLSFANDKIDEAKAFFEKYVKLCHSYDKAVIDQYAEDAIIRRIVIMPDGKTRTIILSTNDYKKKLRFYSPLARIRGYKNVYTDLKFKPEGNNVRIDGTRRVIYESYKSPVSILVGKNGSGRWVIIDETYHTKETRFFKL